MYLFVAIINMGVIMRIFVKNVDINYIQYGEGSDVVLLHGWGQNIAMMDPIGKKLADKYRITILDLPGHGESSEPKEVITIYDYCEILRLFLDKLNIVNPVIIGHSFGGRIGIIYSSLYDVRKLVLLGAPCIRKEEKLSFKVKTLKALKKVPLLNKFEGFAKKHMGSRDYRVASPIMRGILVNTVNEDLSDCARKIKCPVLLIWGDCDTEAPIEDARELEKIIKDAGLVVYENGTHYTYLEFLVPVCKVIKTFI